MGKKNHRGKRAWSVCGLAVLLCCCTAVQELKKAHNYIDSHSKQKIEMLRSRASVCFLALGGCVRVKVLYDSVFQALGPFFSVIILYSSTQQ